MGDSVDRTPSPGKDKRSTFKFDNKRKSEPPLSSLPLLLSPLPPTFLDLDIQKSYVSKAYSPVSSVNESSKTTTAVSSSVNVSRTSASVFSSESLAKTENEQLKDRSVRIPVQLSPNPTNVHALNAEQRVSGILSKNIGSGFKFPLDISSELKIVSLGKIKFQSRGEYNKGNKIPIGFKSLRKYSCIFNPRTKANYLNEILEGNGGKAVFRLSHESGNPVYEAGSCSDVWRQLFKDINVKRVEVGLPLGCMNGSGQNLYGLSNPVVVAAINSLLNNDEQTPTRRSSRKFKHKYVSQHLACEGEESEASTLKSSPMIKKSEKMETRGRESSVNISTNPLRTSARKQTPTEKARSSSIFARKVRYHKNSDYLSPGRIPGKRKRAGSLVPGKPRSRKHVSKGKSDGNLASETGIVLPLTISPSFRIVSLGSLMDDPAYQKKYILPVGYESEKKYASVKNPKMTISYTNQIIRGTDGPIFRVLYKGGMFESKTMSGVWMQIIKRVNAKRKKLGMEEGGATISGPVMFGITHPKVEALLKILTEAKYGKSKQEHKEIRKKVEKVEKAKQQHSSSKDVEKKNEKTKKLGAPLELTPNFRIVSFGMLVEEASFKHKRHLLPVGYESEKEYASVKNPEVTVTYTSKILKGEGGLLFRVIHKGGKPVFESSSMSGAWKKVISAVNAQRKKLGIDHVGGNAISGPIMFGITHPKVVSVLKGLADEKDCEGRTCKLNVAKDNEIKTFEVGEQIEAIWSGDNEYYPGKIEKVNAEGTYNVVFYDGIKEREIETARIRRHFAVGEQVDAIWPEDGSYYRATVEAYYTNGTYDIVYSDGVKRRKVKNSSISKVYAVGETIEAIWPGDGEYYSASIGAVNADGTYNIVFYDGVKEKGIDRLNIRPI